jgi:DNA polymerase I
VIDAMLIELRRGITLHPATFTAVIAPEAVILAALNGNPDLRRFLFLFICGNYSRLISRISRDATNFEVRRPFTADQLLAVLNEAGHTIIFIEYDPTLFEGAGHLLDPVSSALKQAGHESLVILYAPAMDRSFSALARQADRLIELLPPQEPERRPMYPAPRSGRHTALPKAQQTLEVS